MSDQQQTQQPLSQQSQLQQAQQPQLQHPHPQLSQPQQPQQTAQPQPQQPQPQQPPLWLLQRPQQPHQSYTVPLPNAVLIHTDALLRVKQDYNTRVVQKMPPVEVPMEDRQAFNQVLEPLLLQCNLEENRLAMIANVLQQENPIKQFIAIICIVKSQASKVFTDAHPPKYIVTLDTLKKMASDMQRIIQFVERPMAVTANPSLQGQPLPASRKKEQQPAQQQEIQQIYQQLELQHQQLEQFNQLRAQHHFRLQQQMQRQQEQQLLLLQQQQQQQQLLWQQQQQFQLQELQQQQLQPQQQPQPEPAGTDP